MKRITADLVAKLILPIVAIATCSGCDLETVYDSKTAPGSALVGLTPTDQFTAEYREKHLERFGCPRVGEVLGPGTGPGYYLVREGAPSSVTLFDKEDLAEEYFSDIEAAKSWANTVCAMNHPPSVGGNVVALAPTNQLPTMASPALGQAETKEPANQCASSEETRTPAELDRLRAAAEDQEEKGIAAEATKQSRQALQDYVLALQSLPYGTAPDLETRVCERAIKLAGKMKPPPTPSEDYRREMVVGGGTVQGANSPEQYRDAIEHFHKAAGAAPWEPQPYYDLGLILNKLHDCSNASRYLKLYLVASPSAPNARKVQDQIYLLEDQASKAGG